MKKSVRILAVVMALLAVTLVFASCGSTLSGTYTKKGLLANTTLEFSGKNVTISYGEVEVEATYEIEDDKITITIPESDDDSILETAIKEVINGLAGTQSFEKTDKGIKIGGIEYEKK